MLSIAQVFENIHFLTHANYFSQWMRCAIFQINTDLLVIYQNINISTQDNLYPSIIWKKIDALHRKRFSKHPLFTTFSLFWKVSGVCNISNKCWLAHKSPNKIFLHKTTYTPPLFQKKFFPLSSVKTSKNMVKKDVSKSFCDGNCNFVFELKEGFKMPSAKIFYR